MMNAMFAECFSLNSLPNLSKWNLHNIKMKLGIFDECINAVVNPHKNNNKNFK
jgi:surface protein